MRFRSDMVSDEVAIIAQFVRDTSHRLASLAYSGITKQYGAHQPNPKANTRPTRENIAPSTQVLPLVMPRIVKTTVAKRTVAMTPIILNIILRPRSKLQSEIPNPPI